MMINGYRVFVHEAFPKVQLSAKLVEILSHGKAEFAKDMNAWLAGRFGFTERIADGEVLVDESASVMHVNASTYRKMQEAVKGAKHNG